ncbi:TetR/AcrR family transcriptional regulator [Holdemania massiliensis]|uniref:TetR/AcrR family transcriptional regulator n=1 Tax=Holdemania massiliensis TaxID=1468449 RepID=UPI001F05A738|nr:TetR/AcrR family transcriptional regulator [Holdemania massiliensis]MCH1942721.1 TetR/AcrR family transcriptional regulator [Holdemania massiliensis]
MPRNKYPEETVQKILDVSLKLFMEKGYEETTILDIVDHLGGLSRGAFYHHFKSKDEVLNALSDKLFFDNNPFEQVRQEKGLTGLEKLRKVIKTPFLNEELQEINAMSVPLAKNPRILAEYIASNQRVLAPLLEELVEEAIQDGSIPDLKYPKAFSSLFAMIVDIWFMPTIFPCTKEELLERLELIKDLLDKAGIPIMDEEILQLAKQKITQFMESMDQK